MSDEGRVSGADGLDAIERLRAYLDGEQTACERSELEDRLARDARLRRDLQNMRRVREVLARLPRRRAPGFLRREIAGEIRRENGPVVPILRALPRRSAPDIVRERVSRDALRALLRGLPRRQAPRALREVIARRLRALRPPRLRYAAAAVVLFAAAAFLVANARWRPHLPDTGYAFRFASDRTDAGPQAAAPGRGARR